MAAAAKPVPPSLDAEEVGRFDRQATAWWDPNGVFGPLHQMNPVRVDYIRRRVAAARDLPADGARPLAGLRAVDVGCGGGLLSEALARLGAEVVGIDAGSEAIATAAAHAADSGLAIDYRVATAEELAAAGERFDLVCALEIVEHVADVDAFLGAVAALARPGGQLFLSTLNRTPKSFALAIVAAEYVLRWVPRGTHDWRRFPRPSELSAGLRRHGLAVADLSGMVYSPLSRSWSLAPRDLSVNYILEARKPAA